MATKDRLIWADALIRDINADLYRTESEKAYDRCLVHRQPTVNAVVHGRWEWLGPNRLVSECMCGTCSVCKVRSKYIVNTDICPNCGATMDGGADNGI